MKKTLLLLGLLVLAIGVYYYLDSADGEDEKIAAIQSERNFSIDVEEISKITITEKSGKVNTLTREGEIWKVNGKRMSRNQAFLIEEAMERVKMESIPPKKANENIMKTIGRIGILVRAYGKNDEVLRSYYVGGVPQGERGTYYLMEGYSQPYLVNIPGMEGSTRGRFIKKDTDWLDRAMFRFPDKNIEYVSIEYPRSKNSSFKLIKKGGEFIAEPLFSFTPVITTPQNQRVTEDYMEGYYAGFFTEAYQNEHYLKDSITTYMNPYMKMRIVDDQSDTTSLDLYSYNEVNDFQGEATGPSDVSKFVERYYVDVNDGEKFMLTQHVLAKKFLWGYDYFFK